MRRLTAIHVLPTGKASLKIAVAILLFLWYCPLLPRGDHMKNSQITVGSWCEKWFQDNQHKWNANTAGGYQNLIYNRIIPNVGTVPLDDLTEQTAMVFYAKLQAQGFSTRTIWCVHLLLRRCVDEACREQLIAQNPVRNCVVPQAESRVTTPLRLGQIQRYLNAAEQAGVLPIIYIGLTSGLRQCELFDLSWADFYGNYIHRGKRTLVLNDKASALLAQLERSSPCVFLNPKTDVPYQLHEFYYLHKKLLKQARLPRVAFRDLQRQCMEVGV